MFCPLSIASSRSENTVKFFQKIAIECSFWIAEPYTRTWNWLFQSPKLYFTRPSYSFSWILSFLLASATAKPWWYVCAITHSTTRYPAVTDITVPVPGTYRQRTWWYYLFIEDSSYYRYKETSRINQWGWLPVRKWYQVSRYSLPGTILMY